MTRPRHGLTLRAMSERRPKKFHNVGLPYPEGARAIDELQYVLRQCGVRKSIGEAVLDAVICKTNQVRRDANAAKKRGRKP